jgi:hypothetical protein
LKAAHTVLGRRPIEPECCGKSLERLQSVRIGQVDDHPLPIGQWLNLHSCNSAQAWAHLEKSIKRYGYALCLPLGNGSGLELVQHPKSLKIGGDHAIALLLVS